MLLHRPRAAERDTRSSSTSSPGWTPGLAAITLAQHLAGLATGALSYGILWRLGSPRWTATLATGLVVLSAQLVTLEQYILAESLFTLALAGSAFLICGRRSGPAALAASGLLLAFAATLRTAGLFVIPIWLAYVVWHHRSLPRVAAGLLALALPLLAYSAIHAAETGRFGMAQADGWFLYGRVASFAQCSQMNVPDGTESLCEERHQPDSSPAFYVWDPDSPTRAFGNMYDQDLDHRRRVKRAPAGVRHRGHPGRATCLRERRGQRLPPVLPLLAERARCGPG